MRKDYVPVADLRATLDEAGFVEQYWTDQWKDRQQPLDVSSVSRSEEYAVTAPYLTRLPAGGRILDGGCGLGEWTLFLASRGFDTVGLDISETTITRLRQWFPRQAFEHGDMRHTSFATASFDACISWGTFEHFEAGLGGCLEEARRIIKPGGWLFLTVPFHNGRLMRRDAHPLEEWDEHFNPQTGYQQPQRFYQWRLTAPELNRELELHGFRPDHIVPLHKGTGVGRWLQWHVGIRKGSFLYRAAVRACTPLMPSWYISHMIFAAAQHR